MAFMRRLGVMASLVLLLASCTSAGDSTPRTGERRGPGEIQTQEDLGPGVTLDKSDEKDSRFLRLADGSHGVTTKRKGILIRSRPRVASEPRWLEMRNPIDQPLVLLIEDVRTTNKTNEGWLEVLLPERPNGSTAWVARAEVETVKLRHRIEISLSDYKLELYRGNERLHRFRVAIGQDQYPTPRGTFYVWAKVPQPSPTGPYGMYALGISGFSPVLSDWPGGGRSAVHGTSDIADKGQKVSHGCVRVFNADMKKLTGVPMGTPVVIKR